MNAIKKLFLALITVATLFSLALLFLFLPQHSIRLLTTEVPVNLTKSGPPFFKKLPKTDRIDLAWQQENERTMDPALGYVPQERMIVAREISRQRRVQSQSLQKSSSIMGISGIEWTERGPDNIGARTRAIMFDPNDGTGKKVWAGGTTGGLWVNTDITDDDSPWEKINDFWDNIAITCITYDPNDTDIFYLGTGEGFSASSSAASSSSRGAGIWKTTDGGSTWSQLSASTSFYWINDIAVRNESGSSVLYAGVAREYYSFAYSGSNGLFRSSDGGSTFTQVLPDVSGTQYAVADIEIGADKRIYVGTYKNSNGYGGGTILYSDLGTLGNWTVITNYSSIANADRVELACAPSNANIVYALIEAASIVERVGYSDDKGATWSDMTEPADTDTGIPSTDFSRGQAWYDLILAVDPNDATKVYAGAINLFRGVYSSSDITWTQISKWTNSSSLATLDVSVVHADHHGIVFKNGSSDITVFTNDGGIYYSSNTSNSTPTIVKRNKGYNTVQFYAGAIHPEAISSHFLGGAQDNGSMRLTDIGIGSGFTISGGDGAFCHIDQDEPDYQFSAYIYNNLYRSTDGGQSFSEVLADNTGTFINPSDYDDTNDKMYSGYSSGQYLLWSDPQSGATTSAVTVSDFNGGKVTAVTVSPNTGNRVFFGLNNGRVVRVDDAHSSPTTSHINDGAGMSTGSISCIEVENGNDDHLLVTFFNYGVSSIWETSDGGTNWSAVEGDLPDMPVRWALFDPRNTDRAIVATELGVWSTDNLDGISTSWDPSVSGLANVRVDMLQTRTSDNLVLAATHGRGLFTTDAFSTATAQFTADRTTWLINRPVQFTDGSLMATAWSWDFGDGNTSTEENPSHVYTSTGTYTVGLSINSGASTRTKTDYITIISDPAIPYTQDFNTDNGAFYAHSLSDEDNYWQWGASSSTNYNGSRATIEGTANWVTNLTGSHGEDRIYALDSPPFNLDGGTGTYTLDFKYRMLLDGDAGGDVDIAGFNVQYSIDGSATWSILGSDSDTNWYTEASIFGLNREPGFWRASGNFTTIYNPSIDISGLLGNSDVRFRFVFGASNTEWDGVQLDNFRIQGNAISAIPGPTDITGSNISSSSVDLTWSGTSDEFRVVRTTNSPADSPTAGILVYEGTATSASVTGLTELTTYFFTVFGKASGSQGYSSSKQQLAAVPTTSSTVNASVPANHTGNFVLGNSGAQLSVTTNEDSDGGTIQAIRYNGEPSGNNSISGSATSADASTITPTIISPDRFWTITTTLSGSNSYSVTLDIDGLGGVANADKLVIVKRNEGGWVAQNTSRDGTLLTATVSSLSDFGVGADETDNSLPVTLTNFTSHVQRDLIRLYWETESEIENHEFILKRSEDGDYFKVLSRVSGHGSTLQKHNYSYSDEKVVLGKRYHYTLISVDYDGSRHFYDTLRVNFSSEALSQGLPQTFFLTQNAPNPFNPTTKIHYDVPEEAMVSLIIYDVRGQVMRTLHNDLQTAGFHEVQWSGVDDNGAVVSTGIYFCRIQAADYSRTIKMIYLR